jgi:prolyl 4-hydroxylase
MFISGITRLNNIITEEQRLHIKNVILNKQSENKLSLEDDVTNYRNSYGLDRISEIEEYFDYLTPIVESVTKLKLQKENSYSRIYNVDSTLNKHVDREGLDITLSLQIENTTGLSQPIFAENYSGGVNDAALNNSDCVLLKGRDLTHWRNPIESTNPEGILMNVFFHWNIQKGEYLEIDLLDSELCNQIIQESEEIGFNKSEVIQDGKIVHDDYSRSSSTLWFNDTFGITEKIRNAIPTIGNLKFEGWQLIKYKLGEEFKPHLDCLNKENDRLFTTIIYLNDGFTGGETYFPTTEEIIYPKQGKLVIWKNLLSGKCNPKSLHSGNPVLEGTKYALINWVLNHK